MLIFQSISSVVIGFLRFPPSSWYGPVQLDVSMDLFISSSYAICWCVIVHHDHFISVVSLLISLLFLVLFTWFFFFFLVFLKVCQICWTFWKANSIVHYCSSMLCSIYLFSNLFYFCPSAKSVLALFFILVSCVVYLGYLFETFLFYQCKFITINFPSDTLFAASCKFCYVIYSCSFVSRYL